MPARFTNGAANIAKCTIYTALGTTCMASSIPYLGT
jgi:hypothetical protein